MMITAREILDADTAGKLQVFVYCGEIHLIANRKLEFAVSLSYTPRVTINDSNVVTLASCPKATFRFQAASKDEARALASVLRLSLLQVNQSESHGRNELDINPGQVEVKLPL